MSFQDFQTVGSVTHRQVPEQVANLAEALSRIHGSVSIAMENKGTHLYLPSPVCLALDGQVELRKRHLAVNADRYLGLGKWEHQVGSYDKDRSALCMKTDTVYTVSELLSMPPLSERGILAPSEVKVISVDRYLVPDGKGNMIPEGPGTVIPLTQLPPEHPAAGYLLRRGFDLQSLERQFRAGFCEAELPVDPQVGRFYRRLPLGMRDTPQGRIIFFVDMLGVQQGWQARVIDHQDGTNRWMLHPYTRQWVLVERFDPERGKYLPVPEIASSTCDWDVSKYKTGRSALRNGLLMGFDAALLWNAAQRRTSPICILVEGPLDAGRLGPPAIAMLGKHLSDTQADLLVRHFRRVIFVPDQDAAGKKALRRVTDLLSSRVDFDFVDLPPGVKDVGDIQTREEAWSFIEPWLD